MRAKKYYQLRLTFIIDNRYCQYVCQSRLSITNFSRDCQSRLPITSVNHNCQSPASIATVNHQRQSRLNHERQSRISVTSVNHDCQSWVSITSASHERQSRLSIAAINHSVMKSNANSALNEAQYSVRHCSELFKCGWVSTFAACDGCRFIAGCFICVPLCLSVRLSDWPYLLLFGPSVIWFFYRPMKRRWIW